MAKQITNAVLADKIDVLAGEVKHISEMLNGNGQPGLKVRIDRLEQTEGNRKWGLRTIWAAVVSLVLAVAAEWVWR